jgi:hypothetical protein
MREPLALIGLVTPDGSLGDDADFRLRALDCPRARLDGVQRLRAIGGDDMNKTVTHGGLATAAIDGLVVFLYYVSGVLDTLQSWEGAWQQPKLAGDLLKGGVAGLVAFLAAMGVNIGTVLNSLGITLGGKASQ